MDHSNRQCRTCRYFKPAPLRGKGWCHHPFWYTPQHQRLVNARGLECRRPFGDYWKAHADEVAEADELSQIEQLPEELGVVYEIMPGLARLRLSVRPVTLLAPVIVLVLLAAIWLPWRPADEMTEVAADRPGSTIAALSTATTDATSTPSDLAGIVPTVQPTPSPAPSTTSLSSAATQPVLEPQPTAVVIVRSEPPSATATPLPPSPTSAPHVAAEPSAPTATPSPASIDIGAKAVVTSGELRLRVRSVPSLSGKIIGRVNDGAQLSVVAGPREADGETWWQVQHGNLSGWVAGAFLQPTAGG